MGEMKAPVRGTDISPGNGDPFADLAELFEAEIAREDAPHRGAMAAPGNAGRSWAAAPARIDPPSLDDDFDAAFADALVDVDEPAARAPGVARSAASPASLHTTRGPAADRDLNQALRGLSAPARPRDGLVFETQSFAPERIVESDDHQPAQAELDEFDQLIASELAMMQDDRRAPSRGASAFYAEPAHAEDDFGEQGYEAGDPSGAYYDDEERSPVHAAAARGPFRRNMVGLGGGVASLAILCAVGLFLWNGSANSSGASGAAGPLLIKADAEPYKIEPKDPGGRTIPNQNKAVYERVAAAEGQGMPSTTQQVLLTDAEEPIDLPAEEPPAAYEDLPGVDVVGSDAANEGGAEDARLASAVGDVPTPAVEPVGVLQPRKVRTMVVRPDGTLVPASAEPEVAAAAPAVGAATPGLIAVSSPAIASLESRADAPSDVSAATAPAAVAEAPTPSNPPAEAAPAPAADDSASLEVASIAPAEPAVVAPTRAATPAPAGAYYVQISSQPTEALAQQSLRNLTGRFSTAIAGRSVGIQSAEIPGKGTFYRVRVAAASKDEASALCSQLKSAGGNCFVAR